MKCSCGDSKCKSEILWDNASHAITATRGREDKSKDILIYYDANSLIELIKDAKKALEEIIGGES